MFIKILYFLAMGLVSLTANVVTPSMSVGSEGATKVHVVEQKDLSSEIALTKEAFEKFAKGDQDVIAQFDRFCGLLQDGVKTGVLSITGAQDLLRASLFAAEKHQTQTQKNPQKTPYIIHPLDVANRVMSIGGVYDVDVVVAALLHDTLEDTGATYQEIADRFGPKVAGYVQELTDPKGVSMKERKKQQIIHAFHNSQGAAIIKMADKMSNLTILLKSPPSEWSRDRIDQYFQWAQAVIENLPESNTPLKKEVKQVITQYWENQEAKQKQ